MVKKPEFFSEENMSFLMQLILALEEAGAKLENDHDKKDYNGFVKSKKFILKLQGVISEKLK